MEDFCVRFIHDSFVDILMIRHKNIPVPGLKTHWEVRERENGKSVQFGLK